MQCSPPQLGIWLTARRVTATLFALQCLIVLSVAQEESAETNPIDATLERSLHQKLSSLEGITGLKIEVTGGIATLEGKVADSETRSHATEVASSTEGIIEVQNQLILGGDVTDRVSLALDRTVLKLRILAAYIPLVIVALVLFALFAAVASWISRSNLARRLAGENRFMQEVVRQGIKVTIILLGAILALDLVDATSLVGAVFGAAGLAGLAIGFAFKDLIENYIASILLSLRKPFLPNEYIKIGEHEGMVVSLDTRATTLMTLSGNHLRLPNALVFKSVILNYTRNKERRFDFVIGVGADEDLVEAQRIGVNALQEMEGVLDDPPPWAAVDALADSNVSVKYYGWVDQSEFNFAKVRGAAMLLVKSSLEEAGMDLPEPIYRLRLENESSIIDSQTTDNKSARPPRDEMPSVAELKRDTSIDRQLAEELDKSKQNNLLLGDSPSE